MYQAVYSETALRQILGLRPAGKRERILREIERLADNPFTRGNFEMKDETGRKNQVLIVEGWAITYWGDGAVKELRVVDIRKLVR